MLALYVLLWLLLALLHLLLRWRVTQLERRFVRVAGEADTLVQRSSCRAGNSNRVDPLKVARQQYDLARVALKRDRVEERYATWQSLNEKFARCRSRFTNYRGKLMPYLVGVVDVVTMLAVLDRFGISLTQLKTLLGWGA